MPAEHRAGQRGRTRAGGARRTGNRGSAVVRRRRRPVENHEPAGAGPGRSPVVERSRPVKDDRGREAGGPCRRQRLRSTRPPPTGTDRSRRLLSCPQDSLKVPLVMRGTRTRCKGFGHQIVFKSLRTPTIRSQGASSPKRLDIDTGHGTRKETGRSTSLRFRVVSAWIVDHLNPMAYVLRQVPNLVGELHLQSRARVVRVHVVPNPEECPLLDRVASAMRHGRPRRKRREAPEMVCDRTERRVVIE